MSPIDETISTDERGDDAYADYPFVDGNDYDYEEDGADVSRVYITTRTMLRMAWPTMLAAMMMSKRFFDAPWARNADGDEEGGYHYVCNKRLCLRLG